MIIEEDKSTWSGNEIRERVKTAFSTTASVTLLWRGRRIGPLDLINGTNYCKLLWIETPKYRPVETVPIVRPVSVSRPATASGTASRSRRSAPLAAINAAVRASDLATLTTLLAGPRTNLTPTPGTLRASPTPLHLATLSTTQSIALLDLLLGAGATLDADNGLGETPLHYAAFHGNPAAARFLLRLGANVHALSHAGSSPIFMAGQRGRDALVAMLRDDWQADEGTRDRTGRTFLHAVAAAPWTGAADRRGVAGGGEALLLHCLDVRRDAVDVLDGTRRTPLFDAASAGNVEGARLLLSRGANMHLVDVRGATILHAAAKAPKSDAMVAYLAEAAGASPLDVRAADRDGITALHVAAKGTDAQTVHRLISLGADVNARSSDSVTPLMLAAGKASSSRLPVLRALLAAHADPTLALARASGNGNGMRALEVALKARAFLAAAVLASEGHAPIDSLTLDTLVRTQYMGTADERATISAILDAVARPVALSVRFPPHANTLLHHAVTQHSAFLVQLVYERFPSLATVPNAVNVTPAAYTTDVAVRSVLET